MRVLFITLADPDNFGVRCLASYLISYHHEAHIVQLKSCTYNRTVNLPEDPLLLAYGNGSLVHIKFPRVSPTENELLAKKLHEYNPDVVGISIRGVLETLFPPLAALVRKACSRVFLCVGGIGPTLTPAFYLEHGADAAVRGEGEEPLLDLVAALEKKQNWKNIKNICYIKNKRVIKNPVRPREKNLSRFPLPLDDPSFFSYIENDVYAPVPMNTTDISQSSPYALKTYRCITSRGCLGACSYCSAGSVYKLYNKYNKCTPKMSMRTEDHVFNELNRAKTDGYRIIQFDDDFFVRPVHELLSFLERYKKEIDLPYHAFFHPKQLLTHQFLIDIIIDSGNVNFTFGIQHASKVFCEKIYKRKAFSNAYLKLYEAITERGGNVGFQFIGGNPLEREQDFEANLHFIKQFPHDVTHKTALSIGCFYLMFFPGVELIEMFPNIINLPRTTKDWLYRSLLLDIRRLTYDNNFECIRNDPQYYSDLEKLQKLRHFLVRERHYAYVHDFIKTLRGKRVYFWGDSEIYEKKKHLFSDLEPIGMLIDIPKKEIDKIDKIPVKYSDEVLLAQEQHPIIILGKEQNVIFRKILKKNSLYKNIFSCAML